MFFFLTEGRTKWPLRAENSMDPEIRRVEHLLQDILCNIGSVLTDGWEDFGCYPFCKSFCGFLTALEDCFVEICFVDVKKLLCSAFCKGIHSTDTLFKKPVFYISYICDFQCLTHVSQTKPWLSFNFRHPNISELWIIENTALCVRQLRSIPIFRSV